MLNMYISTMLFYTDIFICAYIACHRLILQALITKMPQICHQMLYLWHCKNKIIAYHINWDP